MTCKELQRHFPVDEDENEEAASSFKANSSHAVIKGCVGVLDGLLVETEAPPSNWVANPRSFLSGHCHHLGVIVQAACNAHCRFICLSPSHPGSASDALAHAHSPLLEMSQDLPL